MKQERESNIELLRILTMIGVIILHYNNPIIGGGLSYVLDGSINKEILYILESMFICAVDLFVLISGYFLCKTEKRSMWKPIELIFEVIFFNVIIYIIDCGIGINSLSAKGFLKNLLPANWFVILYCVLYIISPYINLVVNHLSQKSFRQMIIILLSLFSIYPTIIDMFGEILNTEWIGLSSISAYGNQWGYTIINFILLYIIGAYVRIFKKSKSNKILILELILLVMGIYFWAKINDVTGFGTERSAWEYCNPLVIAEAVTFFLIFKNIKIKANKCINYLAQGAFTVYLLHGALIKHIRIEQAVKGSWIYMIFHILFSGLSIYLFCCVVFLMYKRIIMPLWKLCEIKISLPEIVLYNEKE